VTGWAPATSNWPRGWWCAARHLDWVSSADP
jgi:hypothetical protein